MFESSLANREGGDESLRDSKKPEIEFAEEVTKRPLLVGLQFLHVRRKNGKSEETNQLMKLLTNTWTRHVKFNVLSIKDSKLCPTKSEKLASMASVYHLTLGTFLASSK